MTAPGTEPLQLEFCPPPARASSADQTCELEVAHPMLRATMYPPE